MTFTGLWDPDFTFVSSLTLDEWNPRRNGKADVPCHLYDPEGPRSEQA